GYGAGYDPVDERVAKDDGLVQPAHEARIEIPFPRKRANDVTQRGAVVVDQLAWKHDDAARGREVERTRALEQKSRELSRKRPGRPRIEAIRVIENDADFGSVGNDQPNGGIARDGEHGVPLVARGQHAAQGRDDAIRSPRNAILEALR